MTWLVRWAAGICVCCSGAAADDGATAERLLDEAAAAFQAGRTGQGLELAGKAIEADRQSARAYSLRARMYEALRQNDQALADLNAALKLDPKAAELYNRRGAVHFKLGRFKPSVEDFDQFIELRPREEPGHWMRGISHYYAGQYADGVKQFEGYQTVADNDVENAVWRYLCMARLSGVDKARRELLKIKPDSRVPMMEVYALYAGDVQPQDVLSAARAGDPPAEALNRRLFYAHLYLGLYYEAAGDEKRALEHIGRAADEHRISHYMGDVAVVHARLLRANK
jgi:lipoprotein NlpI